MNFRNCVFIGLAIVSTATAASAAEAVWPKNSAGDLAIFATLQRFRIQADHCSAELPELKPKFDSLMESVASRVQGMSEILLATDGFRGLKDKPVPAEIINALKDSFDDTRHNFERRDVVSTCPVTLQNLGEMDDESLRSGLTEVLTAVQNMMRNLEKSRAR